MDQTFLNGIFNTPAAYFVVLIWSMFWKGIALWRASQEKQRNWFIVLLIVNTVGILELVYLFKFAKNKLTFVQMKSWIPSKVIKS